ncbi:MAG: hypothetical protein K6G53_03980 [Bacteroidales bacterium]|nr:hypothetical protein [Bacteroidales bacterium]
MLNNGVARALIKNVPLCLGGIDIVPSMKDYLGLVDYPPKDLSQWCCDFDADVWDARKAFRMQWRSENIIRFNGCNKQAVFAVKCFTVKCLDEKLKFSTMHNQTRYVIRLLNAAIDLCPEHEMLMITSRHILAALDDFSDDINSRLYALLTIKKFVLFVQQELDGLPLVDVAALEKQQLKISDIVSVRHNVKHFPAIPDDLYNGLLTMFHEVMYDKRLPLNDRLTAGIMLLETQLGLRKSEICALEKDFLGYHLCDTGKLEPYISYNCIKASRGDMEVIPIQTWCTELCESTAKDYLELRQQCVYADSTDFLYILDPRSIDRDGLFPVAPYTLLSLYHRICYRYALELIDKDWPNIDRVNAAAIHGSKKYSIPPLHCYRTTVASMAANQNLPYDYIECALSHSPLSEMALPYYGGVTTPSPTGTLAIPAEHISAFEDFIKQYKTI